MVHKTASHFALDVALAFVLVHSNIISMFTVQCLADTYNL